MSSPPSSMSEVGLNIRTMARQKEISFSEATRRIKFLENSNERALDLALEAYEREADPSLLEAIGDLYASLGQRVAAENIFKAMHHDGAHIHVTNMIYAKLPATRALVDDKAKLLFIPIPKCGSSTVKNYFTAAIYGKTYGETVHFKHSELYRTVTAEEMRTTYKDYFRFSVVRDPISRLVSYYTRNVVGGSLRREALGRLDFQAFPTKPGPSTFGMSFHQYRQFFKDFRHHTDPICGYLDPFQGSLDKVYQMSDVPDIRDLLSKTYGCELKDERSMVSKSEDKDKAICKQAFAIHIQWYWKDYSTYFRTIPASSAASD